MNKHADGTLTQEGRKQLRSLAWKCFMSVLGLLGTAGVWIIVQQGESLGHDFVANTPEVVAAQKAATIAQTSASDAKAAALSTGNDSKAAVAAVSQKVDTILEALPKVFASLQQAHTDTQAILVNSAATNTHLSDLDGRMTRMEMKQDQNH